MIFYWVKNMFLVFLRFYCSRSMAFFRKGSDVFGLTPLFLKISNLIMDSDESFNNDLIQIMFVCISGC